MYVFLDIVEQFVCEQCGTCCNREWLVTVDEAGYLRNEKLFAGIGQAEEFHRAFIPLKEGKWFGEYARVGKKKNGGCWFLTADKLCRLQQTAGHEHLDTVCQWFPRYPMDTERGIELSLSFSCPAALRLAMREEPLRIVRCDASPLAAEPVDFITHVYPVQQPLHSPLRYYFELEGHLIDVLQERRLTLPDRLSLVRGTIGRLIEAGAEETPAERLNHLMRQNYAQMDAMAGKAPAVSGVAEWLIENFFVNYIFRKNIYKTGLREAEKVLAKLTERLKPHLCRRPDELPDVETLQETIVWLELELNHQSRRASWISS